VFIRALICTICSVLCFSVIGPFIGGLVFSVYMIPVKGAESLLLPLAFYIFFPGAYAIGFVPSALSGLIFGFLRIYGACRLSRLHSKASKNIYSRDWVQGFIAALGAMVIFVCYFAFLHDRGSGLTVELLFLLFVGTTAGVLTGPLVGRFISMIIPPNKSMHASSA